jgi:hypothetical protein
MRFPIICTLVFLTSCSYMPEFLKMTEDVIEDTAIDLEVNKQMKQKGKQKTEEKQVNDATS